MTSYTADVLMMINNRLDILREELKKHQNSQHSYALQAGIFELMRLGESVSTLAQQEKKEIQARIARDIDNSWKLNPDKSGGAFTEEEINRCRNESW